MRQARHLVVTAALLLFPLIGPAAAEEVGLELTGGVYTIPVQINRSLIMPFIIDSGAADVSIPTDVVKTLLRTGTVTSDDFMGEASFTTADGSTMKSTRLLLREVKVGNQVVESVIASIVPAEGNPLLGQSFLSRLPTWSIDNGRHVVVLNDLPGPPPPPVPRQPTGFLFPNSDRELLAIGDLTVLSCDQLNLARNEIYARDGRYFQRVDLGTYFGRFGWYHPNTWNPNLNSTEEANVQSIQQVERDKNCPHHY